MYPNGTGSPAYYTVVGAGAIGTVVAAALPPARVTLIARGARLAALRMTGIVLETPRGVIARDATVAGSIEAAAGSDVVVLATKTQDIEAACRELALVMPRETPILCCTNGLVAEQIAARWFANVYGVVVMCPATHVTDDAIQAWGTPVPGLFDLGPWFGGDMALAEAIAAELERGGLSSRALPDVRRWKRTKLLANLANAVNALVGSTPDDSLLVRTIRDEGRACFAAAGLPYASPEEDAARRTGFVGFGGGDIPGRTRGGGSTWQSLTRGASLEAEYFNGEICALGREHGVPTPANAAVLRELVRAGASRVPAGSIDIQALTKRCLPDS